MIYQQKTSITNRQRRLTSSNKLGNTLPFRKRSENVGTTLTKPLKNVAFSSRGFDANVVGSRKLSVEIASDEKKGWEGRERREILVDGCRVRRRGKRSLSSELHLSHLVPVAHSRLKSFPSALSLRVCMDPRLVNGGLPPMWTAYRMQPRE